MQKACCNTHMVPQPLVSLRFQVLFHSPFGVLFTFPSRYSCTIGHQCVFSLTEWSPWIPTQFLVLDRTQDTGWRAVIFSLRGCHSLWPVFPDCSDKCCLGNSMGPFRRPLPVLQPPCYNAPKLLRRHRFRLVRFRSPLLAESMFLSFPPGTKMFQFPGFAPLRVTAFLTVGFPHSEIAGSKLAYSSPTLIAASHVLHRQLMPQASTVGPYLLDHITVLLLILC